MAVNKGFQGGNPVLQGIVSGIAQDPDGYMTQRLLPPTPGPHKGTIKVLSGGDHYGSGTDDTLIAPGGSYPKGVVLKFDDVDYKTNKYGKPARIPDEWKDRNELPLDIADMYLSATTHYLKVMQDYRLATILTGGGWAHTYTPDAGDRWTASTSDPIGQLKTARDALVVYPNVMVVGYEAFSALQNNSKVLEGMPTTSPHSLADEQYFADAIAKKLGIQRVLIWDTRKRASDNPEVALTNANIPRMFGKHCWLGTMSQHPGVRARNSELLFNPTAIARVEEEAMQPFFAEDFDTDSEKIKVRHKEIIKLVSTALGGLITNAVA